MLAFLVLLGATVPCLSSLHCLSGEGTRSANATVGQHHECEADADHHGSPARHDHQEGGKSCCCTITDAGTPALPPGPVAFAPVVTFDALVENPITASPPTGATIHVDQIPFLADNSPPGLSLASHFGRAPPVA